MSRFENYLVDVMHGRKGPVAGALRTGLAALAPIYSIGLETYLLPYHLGLRKRTRLDRPVICIGNLTTGGTGKTPMTQTLCRLLQAQGIQIAVLSRGYGGTNEYGFAVVSDGKQVFLNARESGDESNLLAQTLHGVPVLVGKDRRVSGTEAIRRFAPDLLILDDGMQFWQLHRDLDIVLLNACAPFDNGWTFPRGLLREPPSHLKRASVIVLTNARAAGEVKLAQAEAQVRRYAPHCPVFCASLAPTELVQVGEPARYSLDWLRGKRVAVLSAIANPGSFETLIEENGGILAARYRFRDHQPIPDAEMDRIVQEAHSLGAEAIVVTEKDAVKMDCGHTLLPLLALRVEMQIEHEAEFLTVVLNRLNGEDLLRLSVPTGRSITS